MNTQSLNGAQAADLLERSKVLSVTTHCDMKATKLETPEGICILIQAMSDCFTLVH